MDREELLDRYGFLVTGDRAIYIMNATNCTLQNAILCVFCLSLRKYTVRYTTTLMKPIVGVFLHPRKIKIAV